MNKEIITETVLTMNFSEKVNIKCFSVFKNSFCGINSSLLIIIYGCYLLFDCEDYLFPYVHVCTCIWCVCMYVRCMYVCMNVTK